MAGSAGKVTVALIAVVVLVLLVVIVLGLGIGLGVGLKSRSSNYVYRKAAVATDAAVCSQVGVEILKKGGSAVDSAIASMFCVGTVNIHSTGIGGGGFLAYYNATSGRSTFLDFREVAPMAATVNMFSNASSSAGGLAIAVPGMVRGLETAWKMFGRLSWAELIQPSIDIARDGVTVTPTIKESIDYRLDDIISGKYPALQAILAPNNVALKVGDVFKQPQMAETLTNISLYGANYFYNSSFTENMVNELKQDFGSIMTVEDFRNYPVRVRNIITSQFSELQVLGCSPPSSGAVVAMVLNILEGYNLTPNDFGGLTYHRIVEAIKFAYAQRMLLEDPTFNSSVNLIVDYMLNISAATRVRSLITDNTTHDVPYYELPELFSPIPLTGTSHLSVLAENGDAVSTTGTINDLLGSLVTSKKSGIVFNNEMDDFGAPNKTCSLCLPPNYIEPGKRPQSSMSPTIMLDRYGKVKLVIGASGGGFIPTGTIQAILQALRFKRTLSDAIAYPRLYHRLIPNYVMVESKFPVEYRQALVSRNHVVNEYDDWAVVQGIQVIDGLIYAVSDPRKGGAPAGY